jgi:integrase
MTTMNQLRDVYLRTVDADRSLKPSTKQTIASYLTAAFKAWPEAESRDVTSITALEAIEWFSKLKYSASRFNGSLQHTRRLFKLAVTLGFRADNPMSLVNAFPVRIKPPKLPSHEQFRKIIAYLEASPESRRAVRLVKFLAYSGLRIGEALKLTTADITPYGIRVSDAKNGEDAFVPILPEMAELIKTLPTDGRPLFRLKNPRKALANACRSAGTAPLTNHQLRHLFATRCIECGVDIKTVAEWLRHKDGGALALKRYSHVRNEHSKEMATKVHFGSVPETGHASSIAAEPHIEPVEDTSSPEPELEPVAIEDHRTLRVVLDFSQPSLLPERNQTPAVVKSLPDKSAEVTELSPIGLKPKTESQAREPAKVEPLMPMLIQPAKVTYRTLHAVKVEYMAKRTKEIELARLIAFRQRG